MNMNAVSSAVKINSWLQAATQRLTETGISTARLDAMVLLADALGKDKSYLLAHPEQELTPAQSSTLHQQVEARAEHQPLAYLRGKTEFYGREFIINQDVLEPRPESEDMIDLLRSVWTKTHPQPALVDIGSGSGAIGITAALELGATSIDFIDIDSQALVVTELNLKKHGLKCAAIKSDLLGQAPRAYDIILANLPYVPNKFILNQAAMNEPRTAIFGGVDGLDTYRQLFKQLKDRSHQPRYVLTEALPPQHQPLAKLANRAHYQLRDSRGFIQLFYLA